MKKVFGYLFLLVILILPICIVKADGKTLVSNVVATSNIESILSYGSEIVRPTFTITEGVQAHFDFSDGGWYRYENNKWILRSNGYPFSSGRWQFRASLIIDGDYGSAYMLNSQSTLKVDDVSWSFSYRSSMSNSTSSIGYVYSPIYTIEPTGEFNFFAHEKYRIYRTYINEPAYTISVADGVEGGTAPYVFEKVSGPNWLTVSQDGVINGKPTEVGNNIDLVVRATDAENNHKEITIPVEKTILTPAQRELITSVTATSNTSSIPKLNGELTTPTFTITNNSPAVFELYAGGWYKKVGDRLELMTGTFTPGIWHYRTHVAVVGEAGEIYRLSDDTVVTIDGRDWGFAVDGYSNEYMYGWVTSEDFIIKDTIDSVVLNGSFKPPKIGDDIVEPIIWIDLLNNSQDLINQVSLTAKWQYKTGDGFFDWADATGKFEANKTYHIRLMITIDSEIYDFKKIATFPVTFNGYNLTQFQFNEKTVGEFIEFPTLKALTIPVIKISGDNNQLKLTWDNQGAATKYQIFRSTDGKTYTKLTEVTKNEYTNKSLTYGKTYYYKIKACDASKCTGYSNIVKKKVVPNKVTNLVITSAGTSNIKLKYDKVATTGYQVYRSTDNKTWTLIKTITSSDTLTYNNSSLQTNKTYYYKVRAYKTVGSVTTYGSYSNVVSTKTAPVKPKLIISVRSFISLYVKVGEAKGATKYIIQRSLDNKTFETITELTKYGSHSDLNLITGTTYYYRVNACNSQNRCSGWVTGSMEVKPPKPSISLNSPKKYRVNVTLKPVVGADGYVVYRASTKNGKYKTVKVLTSEMELDFLNSTGSGKTYYYKARSYKIVNGRKVYSDYSSIKSIVAK